MDDKSVIINPNASQNTSESGLILPPHLSKFQKKNLVDGAISRLIKQGFFANKEEVLVAAMTCLMKEMAELARQHRETAERMLAESEGAQEPPAAAAQAPTSDEVVK